MKEKLHPPTKQEIAELELFQGFTLKQIRQPQTDVELEEAEQALLACRYLGFDTETKPVFRKDQKTTGPHVVQLCTPDTAYIFQVKNPECHALICKVLAAKTVVKVGFGLQSDRSEIRRKFGIEIASILDLDAIYRKLGYRRQLGVKAAIAVQFGQRFQKSKKVSTSNWAQPELTTPQLLYAANDAYSALRILQGLREAGHDEVISGLIS